MAGAKARGPMRAGGELLHSHGDHADEVNSAEQVVGELASSGAGTRGPKSRARKTSTVPTRIITYGCLAPTEGADILHEQLFLAHRYQQDLVSDELAARAVYREARSALPDVAQLETECDRLTAELDTLRDTIKSLRADARARVRCVGLTAQAKALAAERKVVAQRLREARAEAKPVLAEVSRGIAERKGIFRKARRAQCGVYWGTYLMREGAVDQAAKAKDDPRHRRYDRTGKVGVQLQHGITLAELHGCEDTRLQLAPLPPGQWDTRSGRRRAYTTVRIRVGSEGRAPIWATLPVVMHRPLPKDARIMWAWILVRRIGTDTTYQLQLAVESEEYHARGRGDGWVAVDFGWKSDPGGIAVALAVDEQGGQSPLVLPEIVRQRIEHAESLRAIADRNFNAAKATLVAWLAEHGAPEWMADEARWIHAWRSSRRLATLVARWRDNVTPESADIYTALEAWRRQNRHLYQWECRERTKALRRRKDIYRNWVADLRKRYAHVVTEKCDYRELARDAAPEDDATEYARRQRQIASPGELRGMVKEAFGADGHTALAPAGRTLEGVGEDFAKCWLLLRDAGRDVSMVETVWRENEDRIRKLK